MGKNTMKIEKMEKEIILKREELNKLVAKGIDRDETLRFSQELDVLISEYMKNKYKKIK